MAAQSPSNLTEFGFGPRCVTFRAPEAEQAKQLLNHRRLWSMKMARLNGIRIAHQTHGVQASSEPLFSSCNICAIVVTRSAGDLRKVEFRISRNDFEIVALAVTSGA